MRSLRGYGLNVNAESVGPVGAVGVGAGVLVGAGVFVGAGVADGAAADGSVDAGTLGTADSLGMTVGGPSVDSNVGSAVAVGVQSSTGRGSGAALSCSDDARAQPRSVPASPM